MSSSCLFCLSHLPKPKDSQCVVISNGEKQNILAFKKLFPGNVLALLLKNRLKGFFAHQNSCRLSASVMSS